MNQIIGQTWRHWKKHHAPRMGAALSYYAMLSCIPLLLLIVSASSMLFSKDVVEITLMHQLITTIGTGPARYISELLHNTPLQDISMATAIFNGTLFIIGTLGILSELTLDLNQLWHSTTMEPKIPLSFWSEVVRFIRKKIVALSLVPLLAILLIVSVSITVLVSIIQTKMNLVTSFGYVGALFQIAIPFLLSVTLFTLIYRIVPRRTLPWRVLIVGGVVTAVLFTFGNILIAGYIRLLVHTDIFGTSSSLVGLLVWTYYSAQVFLFGASYTFIYAEKKRVIPSRDQWQ